MPAQKFLPTPASTIARTSPFSESELKIPFISVHAGMWSSLDFSGRLMVSVGSLFSISTLNFWVVFSLIILSQLLYWFWIRNYTLAYFDPNFDSDQKDTLTWFSNLVESIYPRLKTEKYRFDASFFIKKSDQIAIRFLFVSSVFSLFLIPKFYQKTKIAFYELSIRFF
jgi:hypothetical protein